jgi:hypothetical protein
MARKTHVLKKPKELPAPAAATRWHAVAVRPKAVAAKLSRPVERPAV